MGLHLLAHGQASQTQRPVPWTLRVPRGASQGSAEAEGLIMCFMCEAQFGVMSQRFDETFAEYLTCHQRGETRDTPAKRVHDLAFDYQAMCAEDRDMTILLSWYLAITLERLAALETSGIPT